MQSKLLMKGVEITQINVTPFTKYGVLGENWWKCFMQHHPKLTMRSSQSLEVSKTKTLNPKNCLSFYNNLKELYDKHHYPPFYIWNYDD
jgi:hypothetical protein